MNNKFADEKFVDNVESFTGNPLNRKEDVKKLIQIVLEKGNEDKFEKLIFTAKYICGLMRIMKNSTGVSAADSIEHIKEDLNENIRKGVDQIREIITVSDVEKRDYFEKAYLSSATTQSFNNLYQLFSDLEAVKKYVNYLKRLA